MGQKTISQTPLPVLRGGFGGRSQNPGGLLLGTGGQQLSEISPALPTGRSLHSNGDGTWNTTYPDGKILQVYNQILTTAVSISSGATFDIFYDLAKTAPFRTSQANSQILILGSMPAYASSGWGACLLKRDLPELVLCLFAPAWGFNASPAWNYQPHVGTLDVMWLDTPNLAAGTDVTYTIQGKCSSVNTTLNFMPMGQAGSITLMEVGAI